MSSGLGNWAGTYHYGAAEVITARSVEEVQQEVARAAAVGGRVRALGTRHSFTDIADSPGTLISLAGIEPGPELDEAARTVTVGAAATYATLASWLADRGWALANMASLPHISLAGAIATGTHGSGAGNKVLSAAAAGLEYVDASGELRRVTRDAPDGLLPALAVGIGAFGIVTRMTLDVEPSYLVRQDVYAGLPWRAVLEDLEGVMSAAYSVSLFTAWLGESVQLAWLKRRVADPAEPSPPEFRGAPLVDRPVRLADAPADNLNPLGVPGPWQDRLPHFRADAVPSNGDEIQSEFFVPLEAGPDALAAVRRLGKKLAKVLLVSEIRVIAADDLWLSGAYGRPTLAIHFTWKKDAKRVIALLPRLQAALEPFGARPHWGKVWRRFDLAPVCPRLADARELFGRLDPEGRFSNDRLERIGVRAPRPDAV